MAIVKAQWNLPLLDPQSLRKLLGAEPDVADGFKLDRRASESRAAFFFSIGQAF